MIGSGCGKDVSVREWNGEIKKEVAQRAGALEPRHHMELNISG